MSNQWRGNFYRVVRWLPDNGNDEHVNVAVMVYGDGSGPHIARAADLSRAIAFALPGQEAWASELLGRLTEFLAVLWEMDDLTLHTFQGHVYSEFHLSNPLYTASATSDAKHLARLAEHFVKAPLA